MNKAIVIWGIGNNGKSFIKMYPDLDIAFFVDSRPDAEKSGKNEDKNVFSPIVLEGKSKDYFVIVASVYYEEISRQLDKFGYFEGNDYIFYKDLQLRMTANDYIDDLYNNVEKAKQNIKKNSTLLFFCLSQYDATTGGLSYFFRNLSAKLNNSLVLMQEGLWLKDSTKEFLDLKAFVVPEIMGRDQYVSKNGYFVVDEEIEPIKEQYSTNEIIKNVKKYGLTYYADNLRLKYPDMKDNFEYFIVDCVRKYIEELICAVEPKIVILWNEFYAIHGIIREICDSKKVPVFFIEHGNIPGTIQFDRRGQMGESYIALDPYKFKRNELSEQDIIEAKFINKYLRISGENRRKQPADIIYTQMFKIINPKRPVVVFLGQNDYESGIQPYTSCSKEYHSPIFKCSMEAAEHLYELSKKQSWNYFYKPHPLMVKGHRHVFIEKQNEMNTIYNGNINEVVDMADVVVTILSTSAYVALIHDKPVVMLGYTQLKGSGCTYEAFTENDIVSIIKKAIIKGFTKRQRTCFYRHLALMRKHYCFEKNTEDCPLKIGKDINEFEFNKIL